VGCAATSTNRPSERLKIDVFPAVAGIKSTPFMRGKIAAHLRSDLSPEQVTAVMRRRGEQTVSHEHICQHSYTDHRRGGSLNKHLRHGRKKRRKQLEGRIGPEEGRTASALKNVRR